MTRGYSPAVVLCLCALAFVVGRFVQQLPGLPEVGAGVRAPSPPPRSLADSHKRPTRTLHVAVNDAGSGLAWRAGTGARASRQ